MPIKVHDLVDYRRLWLQKKIFKVKLIAPPLLLVLLKYEREVLYSNSRIYGQFATRKWGDILCKGRIIFSTRKLNHREKKSL